MMVEFQEERLVYRNIHKMSEDFVNWFFDERAPGIPKHMHLVTAACMWEGWKGREAREAQPVALNGWRVTVTRTGDRQGVASISGPGVFCMGVPVEYSMLDFMEALTAPLVQTVPDAIITAPLDAMRCGPAASYVLGWNDCRAEVLGESR